MSKMVSENPRILVPFLDVRNPLLIKVIERNIKKSMIPIDNDSIVPL